MASFQARIACGFSFPRMTFSAVGFDGAPMSLVGSMAAVEFRALPGATTALSMNSSVTPEAPAVFTYTPGAVTSTLDIGLSPGQIELDLGVGTWQVVVKVLGPVVGDVWHDVDDMTFTLEIVGA